MAVIPFIFVLQAVAAQDVPKTAIPPHVIGGNSRSCPSSEERNNALTKVTNNVFSYLFNGSLVTVPDCGDGLWYRVAYLNMADSTQQCPSAWREYNTQFRACGRPVTTVASRPASFYSTNRQYSKVCGKVIGIQVASPDAFLRNQGINDGYIDGVSITYGSPRNHVWSYVGAYSEIVRAHDTCPCDNSGGTPPPSFVGTNYYCESGNPNQNWRGQVFPNDKLWDGEQCSHEGTCCTGTSTPPWFSVDLNSSTSDDIEVRIIGTESTENEDTPIELLEIYVQ